MPNVPSASQPLSKGAAKCGMGFGPTLRPLVSVATDDAVAFKGLPAPVQPSSPRPQCLYVRGGGRRPGTLRDERWLKPFTGWRQPDVSGEYLEHKCWYPKDSELCLARMKPGETLVEVRSGSDVQIDRQSWV